MTPRRRIFPLFIPHLGCPHDCVFCNQRRVSGRLRPVTPEEVASALAGLTETVDELAFYGGSFTALSIPEQAALLDAAQPFISCGRVGGIRVSTRPDCVSDEILALLQSRHVETIELGAQSMDDEVLCACGRGHGAEDTVRAAALVKAHGFHLILQMMTGLPGSTEASDLRTGELLSALEPAGVRIYPTVILRDTRLYDLWRQGAYREHTVEDAVSVCARLLPLFEEKRIPVLRLGLNPTEELSRGGAAGGAYHPALGELVKSRIYLEKARALLHMSNHGPDVVLGVCKCELSQMTGQGRRNLTALRGEFSLRSLRVTGADVPRGQVRILSGCLDREEESGFHRI